MMSPTVRPALIAALLIYPILTLSLVPGALTRWGVVLFASAVGVTAWMAYPRGSLTISLTWTRSERALVILGAYALFGGLVARIEDRLNTLWQFGAVVLLVVGLSHLRVRYHRGPTEDSSRQGAFLTSTVSAVMIIVLIGVAVRLGLTADVWKEEWYRQEATFLFVVPIVASLFVPSRLLQLVAVFLLFALFALYPSGTLLVTLGVAVTTAILLILATNRGNAVTWYPKAPLRRRKRATTAVVLMIIGALGIVGLLTSVSVESELAADNPNVELRLELWELGWDEFMRAPILGSEFRGSQTVNAPTATLSEVPLHNDVLTIAALGGLVAVALLAYHLGTCNRMAWTRACNGTLGTEQILMLSTYNAFWAAAFVNPLISNPTYCVLGLLAYVLIEPKSVAACAGGKVQSQVPSV